MNYPESQRSNPCRPPCWRWQRAVYLVDHGRYVCRKRDDEPTRRAAHFERARRRYLSPRGKRNLAKREPDLASAIHIWEEGGRRELELQCRTLARQHPATIARIMACPTSTIETYRSLFFSVEDRIGARSYVIHQVIGVPPTDPPSVLHTMKASCYFHGPHAVDAWLDYFDHSSDIHDLQTPEGRRRRAIELQIRALSLEDSDETQWSLAKTSWLVVGNRRKTAVPVLMREVFAERAAKIMDVLPWSGHHDVGFGQQSSSNTLPSGEEFSRLVEVG